MQPILRAPFDTPQARKVKALISSYASQRSRTENELENCPSRGFVNVHADASAYQRSKSDGGACAAVSCPCLVCVAEEAPSKSMSYGHRVTSTYTCESVTRVLLLLLSCLRFLCIAGEALRPPPRPLPLVIAFVEKRMKLTIVPPADVSAYQRAKSDGVPLLLSAVRALFPLRLGDAAPAPTHPPACRSFCANRRYCWRANHW